MRTLSFENLRRLVSRKKERDEPSFERSESFKRISIRKSYLDRGKRRTRIQINDVKPDNGVSPRSRIGPTIVQVRAGNVSDECDEKKRIIARDDDIESANDYENYEQDDEDEIKVKRDNPASTIVYGQWINDVDSSYSSKDRTCRLDSYSSRDSRYASREKPVYPRPHGKRTNIQSRRIEDERKVSALADLNNSPHMRRPQSRIQHRNELDSIESLENYNPRLPPKDYSCGGISSFDASRFWKDSTSVPATSNYSLSSQGFDSGVDERYNDRSIVSRTVSAPDKSAANKTDTTSTKTSGFSLSLSFSRLTTDLKAAAVTTKNGLFRRRKRTSAVKPSPSVSAEGYFERTAGAAASTAAARRSRRSNVGSGRRRPVYCSRRRKIASGKPSPVVPNSPVWFVPPERRRSNRQRGRVWREVRYLPDDEGKSAGDDNAECIKSNDWSNDSNLSDEFDDKKLLLSGDFEEKPEAKGSGKAQHTENNSSLGGGDSSSLVSSVVNGSLKPKISDFNEDKIFYEEYLGDNKSRAVASFDTKCNYFASSQFLGFVAKSASGRSPINDGTKARWDCGTSSSESEPENQRFLVVVNGDKSDDAKITKERRNCSVVLVLEGQKRPKGSREMGPGQRRRPLRRKSQLKRGGGNNRGQPVYLTRRRSSIRRRPCSKPLL